MPWRIHRVVPFPRRRDVSFAFTASWWGHYAFSLSAFPTAPPAVVRALAPLDAFRTLLRLRRMRKHIRRPVSLLRRLIVRAIRLVVVRCVPGIVGRLVRRRIVPVPLSPSDCLCRRHRVVVANASVWLPVPLVSPAGCIFHRVRIELRS